MIKHNYILLGLGKSLVLLTSDWAWCNQRTEIVMFFVVVTQEIN